MAPHQADRHAQQALDLGGTKPMLGVPPNTNSAAAVRHGMARDDGRGEDRIHKTVRFSPQPYKNNLVGRSLARLIDLPCTLLPPENEYEP